MKIYHNIPITLIIATILVVALSFFLPTQQQKQLAEIFWTEKTFAPSKYDLILVGDSRTYRGVSPNEMEKKLTGMKVLNFAYSNGGLNPTIFEAAEKKLSKEDRQKIIILGVTANCITGYTQNNEQFTIEKNRPREEIIERKYLNPLLYRFAPTTIDLVKDWVTNKKSQNYYSSIYNNNGWVESDKYPADTTEAIESYKKDFASFKVEERYIETMLNQINTWSEKGILVVGFRPPVSQPMRELEDSMGLYNEAEISARFEAAGGHWIDLNMSEYKTYDGSHLGKESALKLSSVLAEQVREILDRIN